MSFNKWKDEYGLEFEPNYSKETELDCKAAFKAGQQSRQDEIDEIVDMVKTSADSEMNLFDELQRVSKDRDGLQKRIDEALTQISNHYHSCIARKNLKRLCAPVSEIAEIEAHESNMTVLENTLKGDEND